MSDIYSNTLHDLINARGASLHFTPSTYDELIGTLAPASSVGSAALNAILLEDKAKTYLTCLPQKSALDKFMRSDDADICIDDEATKDKLAWLAKVGNLEQLLRIAAPDDTANARGLKMLGDNMLWKPSQRRQLVLMLAVQIRSILDVLRAQRGNDNDNWFANGTWLSRRLADADGAFIQASIDGRFEFRLNILPTGARRDELAARVSQSGAQDLIEIAELHDHAVQLSPRYFPPKSHEIVVSVGFNTEMPRFGQAQSRMSISLEAPVLAFLSLGNSKINYGMAAGVFRYEEGREWRSGVSLRPGLVLSQSETFVSMPLRWFHYRMDDGRSIWRPSWGFRVDQGFSSFMTVYLQYTNSPFRQEGDRIGRGLVFGAGVVFAAPLCRVPKLGGWLC